MIENEILILRQVKHEHIVELIEEFETPKEILLVMELVPVKNFRNLSLFSLVYELLSCSSSELRVY